LNWKNYESLLQKRFLKDIKALKSTSVFSKVCKLVFEEIPGYQSFDQLPECKKLKVDDNAYRIRIGDYRIGFFFEDGVIFFSRVLHRSEIYRVFHLSRVC